MYVDCFLCASVCLPFFSCLPYFCHFFQGGKDVASWLRGGVVGQPQYDPVTKEIRASHKTTSDVTQQASLADILSIYLYLSIL